MLRITGELADLAELTAAEAGKVLVNARRGMTRPGVVASGRLVAAVAELDLILGRTGQVIAQTRSRLDGVMPASATRLVSLHDPDARPIAKGRLGKPVEFGYKAQVLDNIDGIVLDHSVHQGNPPDAPLLAPAITRIQTLFGRLVRAVLPTAATAGDPDPTGRRLRTRPRPGLRPIRCSTTTPHNPLPGRSGTPGRRLPAGGHPIRGRNGPRTAGHAAQQVSARARPGHHRWPRRPVMAPFSGGSN